MKYLKFLLLLLISSNVSSQSFIINGIITDDKNNRLLDEVEINIYNMNDEGVIGTTFSNNQGQFIFQVNQKGRFIVRFMRQAYNDQEVYLEINSEVNDLKIKMNRLPGYEFEGTIKELISYSDRKIGKELNNVKIEVYNNTLAKNIVTIEDDPNNSFAANFERGNHYTILLRKKGYFAKRIEVFVDVEGCILCFEGLGTYVSPEIESALTNNNERGSIISDIPMKKIIQDESIVLDNIYYDYNKSNIRKDAIPALENLVRILRRNPIVIELSSHTDSRGENDYNMELSQKRAQSVVDYVESRGIKNSRITAKGYGETELVNQCTDDTKCTENEHQKNRRTEFKVTSFIDDSNFDSKTLKQILELEKVNGKRLKESIIILEN